MRAYEKKKYVKQLKTRAKWSVHHTRNLVRVAAGLRPVPDHLRFDDGLSLPEAAKPARSAVSQ